MAEKQERKQNPYITLPEDNFVRDIMEGKSREQAYIDSFDTDGMSEEDIKYKARLLFQRRHIRKHYQDIFQEMQDKLATGSAYTFEEGVFTLKRLKDKTLLQLEDVQMARDEEIDRLLDEIDQEKNPKKREKLFAEVNKLRRYRTVTTSESLAIQGAIAELNKMHGFNEENVNLGGVVNFIGGAEISDEPLTKEQVIERVGYDPETE